MPKKRNSYPIFIILLIGCFITFLLWSAMRAADSGPEVTDADYYSKGLRYTSTLLEKKAAAVLGWKVETRLKNRTLTFRLKDKKEIPVLDAKGTLNFFLPSTSASISLPLQEIGQGIYFVPLTSDMTGEMNARLEFEREGARINRQLLLNL